MQQGGGNVQERGRGVLGRGRGGCIHSLEGGTSQSGFMGWRVWGACIEEDIDAFISTILCFVFHFPFSCYILISF